MQTLGTHHNRKKYTKYNGKVDIKSSKVKEMENNDVKVERKGLLETAKDAGKKVLGGAKKFVAKTWKFAAGVGVGVLGTVLYNNHHSSDDEFFTEDEIETTEED